MVEYSLVGMAFFRFYMRSGSRIVHSFLFRVVSPSSGGPDMWARIESEKEVYGSIKRHSNQRETKWLNNGYNIFITK